jgi:hypothetical protein
MVQRIKIIEAARYVPLFTYLGNKINNIHTVSRPCHVHINHVHFISHDHSHQASPLAISQVRTVPVALRGVVVRAKNSKKL